MAGGVTVTFFLEYYAIDSRYFFLWTNFITDTTDWLDRLKTESKHIDREVK